METIIKKCGTCRREFESRYDNNFCDSCIEQDREESQNSDCPNCGRTYDDADADFLICHHCGYDAEKKTIDRRKVELNSVRYGIDPDARLDEWDA